MWVKSPAAIAAAGNLLDLQLSGALQVDSGASLDAGSNGYLGTTTAGQAAGAPAGIAGSANAGGSYGGAGDTETGTSGAVYGSVYRPQLAGGGGNRALAAGLARGGGVLKVSAASVALGGQLLAKGESHSGDGFSAGAGGSIQVTAGQLTGAGLIDAGGGTATASGGTCRRHLGRRRRRPGGAPGRRPRRLQSGHPGQGL